MGSIVYDFLADSLFLNERVLSTGFKNESNERIEKELIDYRNHCIKNIEALAAEISDKNSSLSVFSTTQLTPLSTLKQTALYLNQYVVADPLFRFTNLETEMGKVMGKHLGFSDEPFNKKSLLEASKYLKMITPMVAGDFVKVFPVSYHFEAPKQLPLNLPADYYNDILPKEILKLFYDNVIVSKLEKLKDNNGWAIIPSTKLEPCRAISVEFGNIEYQNGMIYFLYENKVIAVNEKTMKVTFAQTLPDTPPDEATFKSWVTQSTNSAAKHFFDRSFGEIVIASALNSSYICDNPFTNQLISKNFEQTNSINSYVSEQLLNIELPFIKDIDVSKLMGIRKYEEDTFTNFRLELEKQFRELRTIKDEETIKLKTENIFHELNEVQGNKIKLKMDHLKKQMYINSALAIGGLIGSVATSGISLLSTGLAIGKGYKDYNDYLEKVKENPAYFLWKVKA